MTVQPRNYPRKRSGVSTVFLSLFVVAGLLTAYSFRDIPVDRVGVVATFGDFSSGPLPGGETHFVPFWSNLILVEIPEESTVVDNVTLRWRPRTDYLLNMMCTNNLDMTWDQENVRLALTRALKQLERSVAENLQSTLAGQGTQFHGEVYSVDQVTEFVVQRVPDVEVLNLVIEQN